MKFLVQALISTVAAIVGGKVVGVRTARKVEAAKEEVRRAEALAKATIVGERTTLQTQLHDVKKLLTESKAREVSLAETVAHLRQCIEEGRSEASTSSPGLAASKVTSACSVQEQSERKEGSADGAERAPIVKVELPVSPTKSEAVAPKLFPTPRTYPSRMDEALDDIIARSRTEQRLRRNARRRGRGASSHVVDAVSGRGGRRGRGRGRVRDSVTAPQAADSAASIENRDREQTTNRFARSRGR